MAFDDQTIDNFLDELEKLYRKYGLSLGHEDEHGAFTIEKFNEGDVKWVREAHRYAKHD